MTRHLLDVDINTRAKRHSGNVGREAKPGSVLRRTDGDFLDVLGRGEDALGGEETRGQRLIVSRSAHGYGNTSRKGDIVFVAIGEPDLERFLDRNQVIGSFTLISPGPENAHALGWLGWVAHDEVESFPPCVHRQAESRESRLPSFHEIPYPMGMLILISPAKTLDYETPPATNVCTQPDFLEEAATLVNGLSKLSEEEISDLMGVSPKLAKLNKERFTNWKAPFTEENAKQAALAFKGDVYEGMRAWEFNADDFAFAQKSLRILSGLYGLLRPLDLMQPYRLEMGTVYGNPAGKDLYAFWGDTLAKAIDEAVEASGSDLLVNLASQEYFKAAKAKNLKARIVSPVFKDEKNGKYKIISFYAKKARGLMSAYLIRNRVTKAEEIAGFDFAGYRFSPEDSTEEAPVFLREERLAKAS